MAGLKRKASAPDSLLIALHEDKGYPNIYSQRRYADKPGHSFDEKELVGSKKKNIDSKYIQIIQIPTNRFDE